MRPPLLTFLLSGHSAPRPSHIRGPALVTFLLMGYSAPQVGHFLLRGHLVAPVVNNLADGLACKTYPKEPSLRPSWRSCRSF